MAATARLNPAGIKSYFDDAQAVPAAPATTPALGLPSTPPVFNDFRDVANFSNPNVSILNPAGKPPEPSPLRGFVDTMRNTPGLTRGDVATPEAPQKESMWKRIMDFKGLAGSDVALPKLNAPELSMNYKGAFLPKDNYTSKPDLQMLPSHQAPKGLPAGLPQMLPSHRAGEVVEVGAAPPVQPTTPQASGTLRVSGGKT